MACSDDDDDAATTTEAPVETTADTEAPETTTAETTPVETTPETTEPAPETTEAEPETTEAPALGSVIDVLTEAGQYTKLLAYIEAAGMTEELSTREVTLLAPTDDAFTAVEQGAAAGLLQDAPTLLQTLQGHVLAAPQDTEAIRLFRNLLAINGASWGVTAGDPLNVGGANIVAPDMPAD
ncbi:MAG TPA: fasciclin domain-containing protein, partial [Ilumatobacteraceae bacterium]